MMKFFRKHTKHLLAVFMALLLIVWLGGTALQNLFERNRGFEEEVVGEAFGQPVKVGDLARVSNQEVIGASLVRSWYVPWIGVLSRMVHDPQAMQRFMYQGRQDRLTPEEWYMLDTEARRNGIHVTQEEVNAYKAAALSPEYLKAVRDRHNLSIRRMDQAIQSYLRIEQAVLQAATAVPLSEADIRNFIRETSEKVDVDMVIVDPQRLIDEQWQPTEEQMKAQFEEYKDKPAGRAGDYGYQLPDATQVEFIEINVDELASRHTVSEDEAYTYWSQHKDEFKKPATRPATTAPATRPEQPKQYETFTEAKPHVIKKLQHDKAVSAANRLAEDLIRELSRPWADQPTTQPGNYKQPPESEMAADVYEKLIAARQEQYGSVLSYGRTELAGADKLTQNPKIGRARAFAGTPQTVAFREAAFAVAGLDADKEANPNMARLFRNVYETCAEPLSDPVGNVYVFRNVAVRPAQAPDSWVDVKDKLVEDLRFERAKGEAQRISKELAERARKSGLKAAFQSDAELAKKLQSSALVQPEPFSRKRMFAMRGMPQVYEGFIPGVGMDPKLADFVFDLAGRATATQPTPVAVYDQEARNRWVVVECQRLLPVTREEYNKQRDIARAYLLTEKRIQFVLDWFSPKNIEARANWHPAHEETPPSAESPQQANATS